MKEYTITITETLQTNVTVGADSLDEAECIVEEQWRAGEHILDAEKFTGVTFTCASDTQAYKELCRSVHDYESRLGITPIESLVEMNPMGLAQFQPKKNAAPEQIESARIYLRAFEAQRSPNAVSISAIENLCSVYPERVVFTMLTQSEKEGFIDYAEQALDYSGQISDWEYRLYQMAVEERAAQSLAGGMDETAAEMPAEMMMP